MIEKWYFIILSRVIRAHHIHHIHGKRIRYVISSDHSGQMNWIRYKAVLLCETFLLRVFFSFAFSLSLSLPASLLRERPLFVSASRPASTLFPSHSIMHRAERAEWRTSLNKLAKRKARNDHADRYLLLHLHTSFVFFLSLILRCYDVKKHVWIIYITCVRYVDYSIGHSDVGVLALWNIHRHTHPHRLSSSISAHCVQTCI